MAKKEKDENKMSPMMTHYLSVKQQYPDSILFYRLGDFYEMFFEDAIEMSKELDLTLTGRDCGLEARAPMCGIPYHAADTYISKLVKNGYKVAICEQLTEPKKGVKIVERDVVRVITPGTIIDQSMLEENKNNYIASVFIDNNKLGVAYADITTGDFYVYENTSEDFAENLNDIFVRLLPSEIIANDTAVNYIKELISFKSAILPKPFEYYSWAYQLESSTKSLKEQFCDNFASIYEIKNKTKAISAAGALVEYLKETQKRSLDHINKISYLSDKKFMILDINTRRNLELTETIRDRKKKGSLLALLDNTSTSMGARMFKSWVEQPLVDSDEINNRLDSVEELVNNIIVRDQLRTTFNKITDIERICGRISYGNFNPKDAVSFREALKNIPDIKKIISNLKTKKIQTFNENIEDFSEVVDLLDRAIVDEPPALTKDGKFIKFGFNNELDEYKTAQTEGKRWINELEQKEKELTGIKNLRIGFNSVFGYFIEVNKSLIDLVPFRYQRKQTIANNERFITEELKLIEEKILGAEEQSIKLEQKLFNEIRNLLNSEIVKFQKLSKIIAELDSLLSFAIIAVKNNYIKPKISKRIKHIKIVDGRHPVVESLIKNDMFVANDTYLNCDTDKSMVITGPNMAGKSTYMRQVALITLMAHIGSFVPAKQAEISITDRIFTRVGASDDLAFGQSTFMVEMSEVANILANMTNDSLIILDEIGRGTSTFDGLSIAWSVMEYLSNKANAKTLFSTHYHELTELEGFLPGVKNYKVTVKEINNDVVFLRKIMRGGTNKSFGIAVAKLAGLPQEVIERASEISKNLEDTEIKRQIAYKNLSKTDNYEQLSQSYSEIVGILNDIDMNRMSPMDSFEILNDLTAKVKRK